MSVTYRGRRAAVLENDALRLAVLEEGGHIAEIFDKETGVNPLWTPPWPSIEPSTYDPETHPEYGNGPDAQLLAGIMGHNLCLDTFGAPSPEEFLAGIPVHGEGSIVPYEIRTAAASLVTTARLPRAGLLFERRIELHGRAVRIQEAVENLSASDRPIAWTQHVTLGRLFLIAARLSFAPVRLVRRFSKANLEMPTTWFRPQNSNGHTPRGRAAATPTSRCWINCHPREHSPRT